MVIASSVLLGMSLQIKDAPHMRLSGSSLIPVTVSAAMLVCSIIRCAVSVAIKDKEATQTQTINHNYRRLIIAIILLIAYALVLESIGFIVSSAILLAVLALLFGLINPLKILALSLSVTLGSWLLFAKIFGSYLPSFTLF